MITLVLLATLAAEVTVRGAAISADSQVVPLEQVLKTPNAYTKTPVVVEGVITKNCSNKGCWMELSPEAGKAGVRVTFKEYAFFIPLDAKGLKVKTEGVTSTKVLSKKHVDHLEGEGAKLTRNADGTATEVSFVASGVELRKP